MRLLFDHNLSYRLAAMLADLYPGSEHVRALGLVTATDAEIWEYGRQNGLAIVSKDSDFYYRSIRFGYPPKVVWIRVGNCSTTQVEALLRTRHADLLAFEQDPASAFLALAW